MRNVIGLVLLTTLLAGCGPKSPLGFSLPDGNSTRGRAAFVELHCTSCHEIEGQDLEYRNGPAHVTLGGKTTRIKTEGELVTSIINPSHKLAPRYPEDQVAVNGQSIMSAAYLNDVMTVQQLIDLVAFLQSTYQIAPPPVPAYWRVYP
jgi:mono/diheme cytochrome c family protein